ncbi:inactive receptor-like serine/threonine-protein kinase At2g40270 isoform X2 [Primulina huaijiensis]|uniref:inactive receptor-like serine/threonine-protein kinase At2g40270 isoform X2 n=1 Tax=Primulina huaijiensis TaxID=1492673 RepID=UPI003CC705ED
MEELWRCRSCLLSALAIGCLYLLNFSFCCSLNDEGLALLRVKEKVFSDPYGALSNWKYEVGVENPCSWVGVGCSEGYVVVLKSEEAKDLSGRKLLQIPSRRTPALKVIFRSPPPQEFGSIQVPPPPRHSQSPPNLAPDSHPSPPPSPAVVVPSLSPSPDIHIPPPSLATPEEEPSTSSQNSSMKSHLGVVLLASIVGPLLILLLVGGILYFHFNKMATVNPWRTGLSGQLQKAFVTGVPKLKRSELVAACEDFSNVIGSSSVCNLYKGTLSNGVEIAVVSTVVASAKEWSNSVESNFRKKIDTLSKVNHKNFVCLLGYCVEEEPFTRMMVFEYAPNGTLFEHLHIREAEHLDWATRLRIAMGVAYCLEHMHQLTHPLAHGNLTSSSVYLTKDYAGKVSDFIYQNEGNLDKIEPNTQSNVYSFGVVLFEMMTGRLPYSVRGESLENWASDYLRVQPLREIVDPTLRTYHEEQLQVIGNVIKMCTNPEPRRRPSMQEVCMMLREATGIGPDAATPKISPLWWAELEILSTEAN